MKKEDLYEGFMLFSRGEQDALFGLIAGNTPTHVCLERLVLAPADWGLFSSSSTCPWTPC